MNMWKSIEISIKLLSCTTRWCKLHFYMPIHFFVQNMKDNLRTPCIFYHPFVSTGKFLINRGHAVNSTMKDVVFECLSCLLHSYISHMKETHQSLSTLVYSLVIYFEQIVYIHFFRLADSFFDVCFKSKSDTLARCSYAS